MNAYAVIAYIHGCLFYDVFDERTVAIEYADSSWDQMCDQEKASLRFFLVAQVELDDNGDVDIHTAKPIKNYNTAKIWKRVFIKNKINKLLTFLKGKGQKWMF